MSMDKYYLWEHLKVTKTKCAYVIGHRVNYSLQHEKAVPCFNHTEKLFSSDSDERKPFVQKLFSMVKT